MPENDILVEVLRGPMVESVHRGALAVFDDEGREVLSIGDVARPVFPRSAVKGIQALPLVESGAADAYGFGAPQLALACSSHSGEPEHVATAGGMLAASGLSAEDLECGAHWPGRQDAFLTAARGYDQPTNLHNNCSGKHSGFLALARRRGHPTAGYIGYDHPVQVEVRAALEEFFGTLGGPQDCGTDGCSIPTYAIPIAALARGFARFGTGRGLEPPRAAAAARLRAACAEAPFMVAGTGRFCTDVMRMFGARVFAKTGAEGVFCAALPDQRLGIALKCDDGGTRAAEVMMAAAIERFLPMSNEERVAFQRFLAPEIRNWRGTRTGEVRMSAGFRERVGV